MNNITGKLRPHRKGKIFFFRTAKRHVLKNSQLPRRKFVLSFELYATICILMLSQCPKLY
jgi:hypothetical protein